MVWPPACIRGPACIRITATYLIPDVRTSRWPWNSWPMSMQFLDPETGLHATYTLFFFLLLSDFPFSKALSFLNRSLFVYLRLIIRTLFLCISAYLTVLVLSNPVLNLIFLLLPITSLIVKARGYAYAKIEYVSVRTCFQKNRIRVWYVSYAEFNSLRLIGNALCSAAHIGLSHQEI